MGTHAAILIHHCDFPKIVEDKSFGNELYGSTNPIVRRQNQVKRNCEYIGEYEGSSSLAVCHQEGIVWAPRERKISRSQTIRHHDVERFFTLVDLSLDSAFILAGKSKVGENLVRTISTFRRFPGMDTVYVEPYDQAIAIVGTFSSKDVGVCILEGGTSWIVGKEETPIWARTSKRSRERARDVLELTLALKQEVEVNLTSEKIRKLLLGNF